MRHMHRRRRTPLVALALAAAASACSSAAAIPERAPKVVTITATDYAFQSPDTLTAGLTTLHLVNRGPDLHHVVVVKLEGGHTPADLLKVMEAHQPFPAWAREVGGPNTPAPGEESQTTLELAAGDYALICVIPARDGVPHIMKGMVRPLTVVPASGADARPAAAPKHDAVMVLDDYTFRLDGPIAAGRRTIRVENAAAQSHEVLVVQLAPGKTGHDVLAWIEKPDGPPPGRPMGGTVGMAKGVVNYVTADFAPGEYALICLIPDAKDGRPHFMHGMMQHVTVQ